MTPKVAEPFFITQCVSNLLKSMIERDLQIIDGITEPLFTALFVQVCQFAAVSSENVDNFKRRNHYLPDCLLLDLIEDCNLMQSYFLTISDNFHNLPQNLP